MVANLILHSFQALVDSWKMLFENGLQLAVSQCIIFSQKSSPTLQMHRYQITRLLIPNVSLLSTMSSSLRCWKCSIMLYSVQRTVCSYHLHWNVQLSNFWISLSLPQAQLHMKGEHFIFHWRFVICITLKT